ncbi:MAG: AAA domain-containing protein [Candidatus Heimdallarchaeaceae archaeon]
MNNREYATDINIKVKQKLESYINALSQKRRIKKAQIAEKISYDDYDLKAITKFIFNYDEKKYLNFKNLVAGNKIEKEEEIFSENINFLPKVIKLDEEQKKLIDAIKINSYNKLFYVSGSSGSGKTEILMEIARKFYYSGLKILVVTETHALVNNLLERFYKFLDLEMKIGSKILRFHTPDTEENAKNKLQNRELERFFNKNMLREFTNNIIKNIKEEKENEEVNKVLRDWKKYLEKCDEKIEEELSEITELLMLNINIVFSTVRAVGRKDSTISAWLERGVDLLILDEASSVKVTDFFIAAIYAKRWLLSGNILHKPQPLQVYEIEEILKKRWADYIKKNDDKITRFLEPRKETLSDKLAKKLHVHKSVTNNKWEQIALELGAKYINTLNMDVYSWIKNEKTNLSSFEEIEFSENYRMRSEYKQLFEKESGNINLDTPLCNYYINNKERSFNTPILFFDTKIREEGGIQEIKEEGETSYYNIAEVRTINEFIQKIKVDVNKNSNIKNEFKILITSSYKKQVHEIKKAVSSVTKPYINVVCETIGSLKGDEADLVIWSLTRAKINPSDKAGIVKRISDIYTVITRPSSALLIVGTKKMLDNLVKYLKRIHKKIGLYNNDITHREKELIIKTTNFFQNIDSHIGEVTIRI